MIENMMSWMPLIISIDLRTLPAAQPISLHNAMVEKMNRQNAEESSDSIIMLIFVV
jgi:hypothetical protein